MCEARIKLVKLLQCSRTSEACTWRSRGYTGYTTKDLAPDVHMVAEEAASSWWSWESVMICLLIVGSVIFFWHGDRRCGQILGPSVLSWSSEVLDQGTKTWLYFSTSYQPPSPFTGNTGSVLGVLLSSSPCLWRKPLKMMSSLCEYRWTSDYPMNSLFLPVAFKDEALPLICLDVSKTICACYRLNLCCSLGPGSSIAGGTRAVPYFYLTFDTWTLSWSAGGVKICIQLM